MLLRFCGFLFAAGRNKDHFVEILKPFGEVRQEFRYYFTFQPVGLHGSRD